ncbi:uncharacterized protein LOC105239918 isoform X2 [Ailuropoda melanoleuca]|uniref:uncharacterized protein LOC105239918 isoform X2 n=1 Tax=Ailuropoda melanoleuca TaxID=9646 RepID=UPI001494B8CD|nr:uncharacterized protein LOC105239918 isoform X2 [Ailuropoda melanoleuca]XP_034514452.1 uncharacterized protein LOC105239918 isoform X2 [Ailuropoda melanoleuca]
MSCTESLVDWRPRLGEGPKPGSWQDVGLKCDDWTPCDGLGCHLLVRTRMTAAGKPGPWLRNRDAPAGTGSGFFTMVSPVPTPFSMGSGGSCLLAWAQSHLAGPGHCLRTDPLEADLGTGALEALPIPRAPHHCCEPELSVCWSAAQGTCTSTGVLQAPWSTLQEPRITSQIHLRGCSQRTTQRRRWPGRPP